MRDVRQRGEPVGVHCDGGAREVCGVSTRAVFGRQDVQELLPCPLLEP